MPPPPQEAPRFTAQLRLAKLQPPKVPTQAKEKRRRQQLQLQRRRNTNQAGQEEAESARLLSRNAPTINQFYCDASFLRFAECASRCVLALGVALRKSAAFPVASCAKVANFKCPSRNVSLQFAFFAFFAFSSRLVSFRFVSFRLVE